MTNRKDTAYLPAREPLRKVMHQALHVLTGEQLVDKLGGNLPAFMMLVNEAAALYLEGREWVEPVQYGLHNDDTDEYLDVPLGTTAGAAWRNAYEVARLAKKDEGKDFPTWREGMVNDGWYAHKCYRVDVPIIEPVGGYPAVYVDASYCPASKWAAAAATVYLNPNDRGTSYTFTHGEGTLGSSLEAEAWAIREAVGAAFGHDVAVCEGLELHVCNDNLHTIQALWQAQDGGKPRNYSAPIDGTVSAILAQGVATGVRLVFEHLQARSSDRAWLVDNKAKQALRQHKAECTGAA